MRRRTATPLPDPVRSSPGFPQFCSDEEARHGNNVWIRPVKRCRQSWFTSLPAAIERRPNLETCILLIPSEEGEYLGWEKRRSLNPSQAARYRELARSITDRAEPVGHDPGAGRVRPAAHDNGGPERVPLWVTRLSMNSLLVRRSAGRVRKGIPATKPD